MFYIDINSDVGEGLGNEAQLMPMLSSCNIACGAHAGSPEIMEDVSAFAKAHSVKIGAHPSYPDRANFGREVMDISLVDLKKSILEQILTLKEIVEKQGQELHHVKPHGALYNKAAVNFKTADVLIEVIQEIDDSLILYVPYHSVIGQRAKGLLRTMVEGFADRNYNSDYTLVSRSLPGALIETPEEVLRHVLPMITENKLQPILGRTIPFNIQTLCVHGDTKAALDIVSFLYEQLPKHNVTLS